MKAKVSLGLHKQSVPQKIEKGRTIVTAMTSNANFATPVPALPNVTLALDDLDAAFQAAEQGGKPQKLLMYQKERIVDDLLTQLGLYVEATAAGDEAIIASSGMDVKRPPSPPAELPAPTNVEASTGEGEGTAKLRWKVLKRAASYLIEMAVMEESSNSRPSLSWVQAGFCTKSSFELQGLIPGAKYMFRVAAIGAKGLGPFSDAASCRVL